MAVLGKDDTFALYQGTLARSLVPVYTAAIVLLGGVAQPLLLREEARWLREDTLVFPKGDTAGFSPLETRSVEKVKREMLAVAAELERRR